MCDWCRGWLQNYHFKSLYTNPRISTEAFPHKFPASYVLLQSWPNKIRKWPTKQLLQPLTKHKVLKKSDLYYEKKTTQFFVFFVMILRYLQINLHQMIKMTIFMTKDNFSKKQTKKQTKNLAKNSRKGKQNFLQSHKKHKKSTSLVMGPTYPVKENISR